MEGQLHPKAQSSAAHHQTSKSTKGVVLFAERGIELLLQVVAEVAAVGAPPRTKLLNLSRAQILITKRHFSSFEEVMPSMRPAAFLHSANLVAKVTWPAKAGVGYADSCGVQVQLKLFNLG